MSSKQNRWQGSEQIGITSRELFGPKHRVLWSVTLGRCSSGESSEKQAVYLQWAREDCNPFTLVHLPNFSYHFTPQATIGNQIVDTLSLNGVSFREQNNPHPTLSPPFKVGVFVVFYKKLDQWHNVAYKWYGEAKNSFSLLELAKCQKGPLGKSVSTNFVTNVANNSEVHQNIPFVNLKTQLFSKGQKLIFIIAFQE